MTNEEREIITRFIERVSGAGRPANIGSVPGTAPPLPPIDREADALIADLFNRYPEARYRLTQTAFVQEHALAEAQNRIKRLEWELEQARQAAQASQAQQDQGQRSGGFFSSLFGGGQSRPASAPGPQGPLWNQGAPQQQPQYQPPPQPQPQYMPGYQPGLFQRGGGSGFLGSALTTAAGVAGGMVAGNALMNLFSGHHGGEGLGGFAGGAPADYVPADNAEPASPWSGSEPAPPDPAYEQAGWDQGGADPGQVPPDDQTAWNDPGNTDFDQSSFDDDNTV
jgi:hypothetical protein